MGASTTSLPTSSTSTNRHRRCRQTDVDDVDFVTLLLCILGYFVQAPECHPARGGCHRVLCPVPLSAPSAGRWGSPCREGESSVPLAFFFLVMNPEHVGGKDGDAASPHLLNLAPPFMLGHTAVVHLAHHGQHVLAADDEAAAVNLEFHTIGVCVGAKTKEAVSVTFDTASIALIIDV